MELLQGATATLRFPGPLDDPVTFTSTPKVTVTRHSDGSPLVADVVSTPVEAEGEDTYWTVDLDGASLAEVDVLRVAWSDGSSTYRTFAEIVGGQVVSLKAIAQRFGEHSKSQDPAILAEAREAATQQVESACGVAFRSRYAKERLDGSGTERLLLGLPRVQRVLSVTVNGSEVDAEGMVINPAAGTLTNPGGWPAGHLNVEVAYVHGYEHFPLAAEPVRDLAAHMLEGTPTDFAQRASRVTNDTGDTYALILPGVSGVMFPLPVVNAFVQAHRFITVGS